MLITAKSKPFPVTSLIEMDDANERRFGLVRWYQATLQGEIRSGVQFIATKLLEAKVRRVHFTPAQSQDKYWQGLLEQTTQGWNLWLGNWRGMPRPMTVAVKRDQQAEITCRITPTGMIGVNYAVFALTEIVSQQAESGSEDSTMPKGSHTCVMVLPDLPE
ncbi:MAG: hypothetical protein R8K20_10675 [Gallionellaceae bacterium]